MKKNSRKEIVEHELGVRIPSDYAAFLEKYGIYCSHGAEVYGINESLLRYDGIPCVIGATNMHRRDEGLPHHFLVIHHTGIEDETICLDTKWGKVYLFSWVFGDRKIADSFDEWFQRDIIEYYKTDRPDKYAGEKIIMIDKIKERDRRQTASIDLLNGCVHEITGNEWHSHIVEVQK